MPAEERVSGPAGARGVSVRKKPIEMTKFGNEGEEADWWASPPRSRVLKAEIDWCGEGWGCDDRVTPGRPVERDRLRTDSALLARTLRDEGALTRYTQGHRVLGADQGCCYMKASAARHEVDAF